MAPSRSPEPYAASAGPAFSKKAPALGTPMSGGSSRASV